MESIVIGIVALALGFVIGWLVVRVQKQSLISQVDVLNARIEDAKVASETAKTDFQAQLEKEERESKEQIEALKLEAQTRLEEEKQKLENLYKEKLTDKENAYKGLLAEQEIRHKQATEAQKAYFDQTMESLNANMKEATDNLLKKRQEEFADSSSSNLKQIVDPLKEKMAEMEKAMKEGVQKQIDLGGEMRTYANTMIDQSKVAQKSAEELTKAFKHGSKMQGDWGEKVLQNLLDSQGLVNGLQYDLQPYIRDENNNIVTNESGYKMRPDVILHLDTKRDVIIDSKVSLTAYMDYVNADSMEKKDQFLKQHIASLRKHVKELSDKDYSSYVQPPRMKMGYVIMFVPHSGALWTAISADANLWSDAMKMNVYIADEQTLYAALRMIDLTWTQIKQAENHEKVYEIASEIVKRVGMFTEHYNKIGSALQDVVKAYNNGQAKLSEKGQSISKKCNELIELGAKQDSKYKLPTNADDVPQIEAPALLS